MQLKESINAWIAKSPGWMLVIVWLLASFVVYTVVSGCAYTFMIICDTGIGVPIIACGGSAVILTIWHVRKAPKLKLWVWLLIGVALAFVIGPLFIAIAWAGLYVMGTPIGALLSSLIVGGIIVGALVLNEKYKK